VPSVPVRASRSPIPAALVGLAFLLALIQRPGEVVADTKVNLYVDPARFLGHVLSAWTPTGDLGHVWAGQYAGYAWPMAPWFAAGDALGLPVWLVHRLWLGTLLALAALGMVRLLQALVRRELGTLHLVAGVLYVVNPYVTVYANRTSVALLAYAALPWLLLATHRALRNPRGWRGPALFALILTSTAGGINATVTFFVLLAPVLLAGYELVLGTVDRRAVWSVLWR
jgi:arabinofuranan 3-O-arabinosyltransferase